MLTTPVASLKALKKGSCVTNPQDVKYEQVFSPNKVFNRGQTEQSTATQKWSYFTYLCLSAGIMLRTSPLVYFFLQFSLSILPVFNWVHRRHSCLLPFIHQLHSPVPVYLQQELKWVAGLLHEASHYTPTLLPGEAPRAGSHPVTLQGKAVSRLHQGFKACRQDTWLEILFCAVVPGAFCASSLPTFGYHKYLTSVQLEQFV